MKITSDMIDLSCVDVMFEITRWCNMLCPHCIRGDRQKLRMKRETITKVISQFDYISILMVTGGEPTLAVDLMEDIYQYLLWNQTLIGGFWMATNGSNPKRRFFNILRRFFEYADEKELNGLRVSIDPYHERIDKYSWQDFEEEIGMEFDYTGAPLDSTYLIGEGRAKENYYTKRNIANDLTLGQDGRVDGTLYITAKGNIVSTCDISYRTADDVKSPFYVGNVDEDIKESLARFFNDHPDYVDENFEPEKMEE